MQISLAKVRDTTMRICAYSARDYRPALSCRRQSGDWQVQLPRCLARYTLFAANTSIIVLVLQLLRFIEGPATIGTDILLPSLSLAINDIVVAIFIDDNADDEITTTLAIVHTR